MALTFFWRCESETLDSTHDFSAGDDTASAFGTIALDSAAARVGTNGILVSNTNTQYRFNPASIFDRLEGSAAFSFRLTANPSGISSMLFVRGASFNDYLMLAAVNDFSAGSGTVRFVLRSTDTGGEEITVLATGNGLSLNTWYGGVIRWDQANSLLRVEIYDNSGTLVASGERTEAFVAPLDFNENAGFRIGEAAGSTMRLHIDNVFVSDSYDEPLQHNLTISSYTEYSAVIPDEITGSGAVAATMPEAEGTGSRGVQDVGSTVELFAPVPTVSGEGTVETGEIAGSGDITAPLSAVSGAGVRIITGSGAVEATLPEIAGSGGRRVTGSGAILSTVPSVSGQDGPKTVTGNSALSAPLPSVAGTGTRTVTGSGALVASLPRIRTPSLTPTDSFTPGLTRSMTRSMWKAVA